MQRVLGIDVGGTSIKVGAFSPDGQLLETKVLPTPNLTTQESFASVVEAISRMLLALDCTPQEVIACGLDIPCPVADDGTVMLQANVSIDADGLVQALSDAFPHASMTFVNDANAAALGEMWGGAARGMTSFVLIALGTGVGAGIVANGRLIAGAFGAGGEVGHMTVEPGEDRVCGCGRKGCLEQYASATGIVHLYQEECRRRGVRGAEIKHATDTLSVFQALANGDECAQRAVGQMCDYLGGAMAQMSCVVDPKLFLIGGGVAGSFAAFAPQLREAFRKHALAASADARIEAASLGNQAAMYGCAFEALRLHNSLRED